MPNVLDIFSTDPSYRVVALTTWINKMPFVPGRLASLFPFQGETTTSVLLERESGKISLIPAKTRGSGGTTALAKPKRDVRPFVMAHLPHTAALMADDIQGVREFGSADAAKTVARETTKILAQLRQNHEVTHEYQRVGAIQGLVLDADGTTPLIDLFSDFGITRTEVDFELDDQLTKVELKCTEVRRRIEEALGGVSNVGVVAQVGSGFWDALMIHDRVRHAFERFQDNVFQREGPSVEGMVERFPYRGIMFERYRGQINGIPFIPHNEAAFYPIGVPDLFKHHGAPADYVESVNTRAQNIYSKQEPMKFGKGIEFESQSNPAMLCTRPEVLIRGFTQLPEEVPDPMA